MQNAGQYTYAHHKNLMYYLLYYSQSSNPDVKDTEEALVEYAKAMSQGSEDKPTTSVKESDLMYVCHIPLPGFKGIIIAYTIFSASNPTSLKEAIVQLQARLASEEVEFQVRRGHVLQDVLREVGKRAYHPLKRISVCYKKIFS
jgi:hypothetical protein